MGAPLVNESLRRGYGSISRQFSSMTDESAEPPSTCKKASPEKFRFLTLVGCLYVFLVWITNDDNSNNSDKDTNSVSKTQAAVASTPKGASLGLVGSTKNTKKHAHKHHHNHVDDGDDSTKTYHYFDQIVDHNHPRSSGTFSMRYMQNKRHWKGPGHPIFLILGGEGPLERILYPFVSETLAWKLGAITYSTEHRYFGESFPVWDFTKQEIGNQIKPRQVLLDQVHFIQCKRRELGCDLEDRTSPHYCPVLAVGASYSGMLSALMRKEYPNIVDIAYAASPCLFLFGHQATPYVYYEYITQVAERISPGCANAVRDASAEIQSDLESMNGSDSNSSREDLRTKAQEYGICPDTLPKYIETPTQLAKKIVDYTSTHFAQTNLDYYPPTPDQPFFQGCRIFQDTENTVSERMREYVALIVGSSRSQEGDHGSTKSQQQQQSCYDMSKPTNTDLWDAVCCYLVPMIGKSTRSMWPAQPYRLQDDIEYCERDFGITVDPHYMEKEFDLQDLSNVTRLVLTNGFNDGFYPLSPNTVIPGNEKGVVIFNMENGAHHSDLTHHLQKDTPDVDLVHSQIADLIEAWLIEIHEEPQHQQQ